MVWSEGLADWWRVVWDRGRLTDYCLDSGDNHAISSELRWRRMNIGQTALYASMPKKLYPTFKDLPHRRTLIDFWS